MSETVEMSTIVTTSIARYGQGTIFNRSMVSLIRVVLFIFGRLLKSPFKNHLLWEPLMRTLFFFPLTVAFLCFSVCALSAPPDIIVFDFGGVVGKKDFKELAKKVRKELALSHSAAIDLIKSIEKHKAIKKGKQGFWDNYQMKLGRELPMGWPKRYEKMREESLRIHPEIAKIIRELKRQGCKIAMLSNVSSERAQTIQRLGLYKNFRPAVLSCYINADKPSAKAYKILLEKLGNVAPERCFFIDDKQKNVSAAIRMGIRAVRYTSAARLRWDLELRDILPPRKIHFKGKSS